MRLSLPALNQRNKSEAGRDKRILVLLTKSRDGYILNNTEEIDQ